MRAWASEPSPFCRERRKGRLVFLRRGAGLPGLPAAAGDGKKRRPQPGLSCRAVSIDCREHDNPFGVEGAERILCAFQVRCRNQRLARIHPPVKPGRITSHSSKQIASGSKNALDQDGHSWLHCENHSWARAAERGPPTRLVAMKGCAYVGYLAWIDHTRNRTSMTPHPNHAPLPSGRERPLISARAAAATAGWRRG